MQLYNNQRLTLKIDYYKLKFFIENKITEYVNIFFYIIELINPINRIKIK